MINKTRFWEIDALRGIAIMMMIIFHTLFAIEFFSNNTHTGNSTFWIIFARITAIIFILVAGISIHLSYSRTEMIRGRDTWKKYLIRGLKIISWGAAVSIVTFLYLKEGAVLFGILHFIGISVILIYPFIRMKESLLLTFSAIAIIIGILLQSITATTTWMVWLGIRPTTFYTLDYFPLLPWFGVILIGLVIGKKLYPDHKRAKLGSIRISNKMPYLCQILTTLGRHSLLIYLIHIPIIILITGTF